jgi:hypothetical protein
MSGSVIGTQLNTTLNVSSIHTNPAALSIRSSTGDGSLLEIRFDGTIIWNGPTSKAARLFLSSMRSVLDLDAIGEQAAERIYRRAIAKCLRMAREMEHDEFIDRLDQELQARTSKAVLMELKRNDGTVE